MDSWGNRLYTGEVSYDFVGRRRLWYMIAAVVVLISIAAFVFRGFNLGIEFSGGSEFRVSNIAGQIDQSAAEDAVQTVDPVAEVRVSTVGTNSLRVQTGELSDAQTDEVRLALVDAYAVDQNQVTSSFIGPSWGQDVSQRAIQALLVFLVLVAIAITLYFRTWKMAVAALVALIHDVVATIGVYALVGFEVTPASVIGFLTILGYSLYDTVVVFDKVRENTEHVVEGQTRTFGEAANLAVNQTLIRSINTSVVALLPVGAILFVGTFILGAGTLRDLSLALFVGMALGTYSSIFIATPLLVHLREREPAILAQAKRVAARRQKTPAQKVLVPAAASPMPANSTDSPTVANGSSAAGVSVAAGASVDEDDAEVAGALDGEPEPGHDRSRRLPLRTPAGGGQRPQPRRGRRR